MTRASRLGIAVLLLAGTMAPLPAQELKDALRLLPPTTQSLEVYRDAATLEKSSGRVAARFTDGSPSTFRDFLPGLNLDMTLLPKGFSLVVDVSPADSKLKRQACLIPVRAFPGLVKALKAVKASGHYSFMSGRATFHMARCGTYAVISADPKLLSEFTGKGETLAPELVPLAPWISSHDLVWLAPSSTLRPLFSRLRSGLAPKAGSPPNAMAMAKLFKPLVDMAETSVAEAALAVDFPEDGALRAQARVFLRPGSPMAQAATDTPPDHLHPMAGLPAQGFVLGGGWSLSAPFRGWLDQFAGLGAELAPAGADPAAAAKGLALMRTLNAQVQSQAMSLGLPGKAGDPLFGQFRFQSRVDDAAAYLGTWTELVEHQIRTALFPAGLEPALVKQVLPGVPSASLTFGLKGLEALSVPPGQLKMILTVLVGQPDHISFSMAQVDSHTVIGVLGGAPELKAALAPVSASLDRDPGIAASDALLPAQASCRYYVAIDGVMALVQQVVDTFSPGAARKTLPVLASAPPLALALHSDAQGLIFSVAATPATLDAMAGFVAGMQLLAPKKPQPRPEPKQ